MSFEIKSTGTMILSIISYFTAILFSFQGKERMAEKGASWFFIFFAVAMVQLFLTKHGENT